MKRNIIKIKANTKLSDLKVGDLVMTGELMRVEVVEKKTKRNEFNIVVSHVRPRCGTCFGKRKCQHYCGKYVGWGQQGIQKVLSRT